MDKTDKSQTEPAEDKKSVPGLQGLGSVILQVICAPRHTQCTCRNRAGVLTGVKADDKGKQKHKSEEASEKPNGRAANNEPGNCYCGKERNLNIVELLCASCSRWFHESCIGYQLGKLVPFMMNYIFMCKNCSPTGLESFKKNQAPFPQMCVTAIANLLQMAQKDSESRIIFHKDKDIIPFIECHWDSMTTMPRRVTQSWHATIHRALLKDVGALFTIDESSSDGQLFGLVCSDLLMIKPNYEAMIKGGHLKVTEMGVQHVVCIYFSVYDATGCRRKTDGCRRMPLDVAECHRMPPENRRMPSDTPGCRRKTAGYRTPDSSSTVVV